MAFVGDGVSLEDINQVRKKAKFAHKEHLFAPYHAIGFVIDQNPFQVVTKGTKTFIVASIKKTWQIFRGDHLTTAVVGKQHDRNIRCITAYGKRVYSAAGNTIYFWKRGRLVTTITCDANVFQLYMFGKNLISISEDNIVTVWSPNLEAITNISFHTDFHATHILHPATYLDKVLIGSREGILQLWNIKTKKLIYSFEQWKGVAITCLSQSPAVDVVGIGLADGRIIVHNLKFDKSVTTFVQAEGYVTSLTFRTDKNPYLASGNYQGSIVVWDLEKKKLQTIIRDAHDGTVTGIQFLSSEPVLLSSGNDNSIKMWIFDQPDGGARLLRSRTGHSMPPHNMKFSPQMGFVFTASPDRQFRAMKITGSTNCFELSQKAQTKKAASIKAINVESKLSPIVDFDVSHSKYGVWDNCLSCHEDGTRAHTWDTYKRTLGKHSFHLKEHPPTPIKSVAISTCGNFGILGSAGGSIDKFNLQSGMYRSSFVDKVVGRAHKSAITGIAVDALNKFVVSSSLDGTVKIWNLTTSDLLNTLSIGIPITKFHLQKNNNLFAVVCDDLSIRVFDLDTNRNVRKLEGHSEPITAMVFSPDGRLLVSTSNDCIVRIWDLPTGQMMDWFLVEKPITALDFDARGSMLITTHARSVGIYLWVNKSFYTNLYISPPDTSSKPDLISMPTIEKGDEHEEDGEDEEEEKNDEEDDLIDNQDENDVMEQNEIDGLSKYDLVKLSGLPPAKWQTIPDWDLIKQRNKPKEPVQKPKHAPFFLPTMPGTDKFILPTNDDTDKSSTSRIMKLTDEGENKTKFMEALERGHSSSDYTEALDMLKEMTPASVDFEFRSLSLANNFKQLRLVLSMISNQLETKHDFELINSYLNLLLKIHGDILMQHSELAEEVKSLEERTKLEWERLQYMFQNSLCLLRFFSNLQ